MRYVKQVTCAVVVAVVPTVYLVLLGCRNDNMAEQLRPAIDGGYFELYVLRSAPDELHAVPIESDGKMWHRAAEPIIDLDSCKYDKTTATTHDEDWYIRVYLKGSEVPRITAWSTKNRETAVGVFINQEIVFTSKGGLGPVLAIPCSNRQEAERIAARMRAGGEKADADDEMPTPKPP